MIKISHFSVKGQSLKSISVIILPNRPQANGEETAEELIGKKTMPFVHFVYENLEIQWVNKASADSVKKSARDDWTQILQVLR